MSTARQQQNSLNDPSEMTIEASYDFEERLNNLRAVLHWYDFLCPFCYVGQQRTAILIRHELDVIELPFQAHPDIPLAGVAMGPRNGPMYKHLEREAKEAGLALKLACTSSEYSPRFVRCRVGKTA